MKRLVAILLLVSLTATSGSAAAQEGSPEPEDRDETLVGLRGVQDGVARDFAASGFRLIGTLFLGFVAAEFDDEETASAAMPVIVDRYFQRIETDGDDPSGLRPSSVRELGDDRIAYAGEVLTPAQDVDSLAVALLLVREGNVVHVMFGFALAGDPLTDLTGVAEKVLGRKPGGDETPVAADGLREGGLWDLLPRLADLPEGFVLDEESVPAPFAPLPGQGTPEAG